MSRVDGMRRIYNLKMELANEIELFGEHSRRIANAGLILVERLNSETDSNGFVEGFPVVYRYFSRVVALISDLNIQLEKLILEEEAPGEVRSFELPSKEGRDAEFDEEAANLTLRKEVLTYEEADNFNYEQRFIRSKSTTLTICGRTVSKLETNAWSSHLFPQNLLPSPKIASNPRGIYNFASSHPGLDVRFADRCDSLTPAAPRPRPLPDKPMRALNFDRKIGATHNVTLLRVVSPAEFYVRVRCDESALMDEMNAKLEARSGPDRDDKSGLKVRGCCVLALHPKSGRWCRAEVLDWRSDSFLAFFFDHGDSSWVPARRVRTMDPSLKTYPRFAQKCYLSGICPEGDSGWSDDAKTVFELFVESRQEFSVGITEKCVDALGVRLTFPETGVCVNDKLAEYGVANRTSTRGTKGSYMPPRTAGDTLYVLITWIKRADVFFCVSDCDGNDVADDLSSLIAAMNDDADLREIDGGPDVGQLVLGKYEDGLWYRAKVVKCDRTRGACTLLFVDYGNRQRVAFADVREMKDEYLELPFQMMECHLTDVEVSDRDEQRTAIEHLYAKVNDDKLYIKIREVKRDVPARYGVSLFDRAGNDVARSLPHGKASPRPTPEKEFAD